jgi:phosphonate degradation associated HDIG domain protein
MTPPLPERPATTELILQLMRERGASRYGHEAVSQIEHAIQAASLAVAEGASAAEIVAALLHDIGHLLHGLPDDAPDQGIDDRHEELAARWLQRRFGPEVVEPVRLHVAAKRYLCTVEPGYREQLSPPSLQSLALQGGPMTDAEAADFRAGPHASAAISLRRRDDAAKVPDLETLPLEAFAVHLELALNRGEAEERG